VSAVLIVCPRTGASVPTGLHLDTEGLRALSPRVMRMRCASCKSEHAWSKGIAFVSTAPTPATVTPQSAQPVSSFTARDALFASPSLEERFNRIEERFRARAARVARWSLRGSGG